MNLQTIHKQNEKFNKEIENIKKNQTEILELKNTMTKLKNSIDTFDSRSDHAGERISKFKDKPFHIIQLEEQKERRPKKERRRLRWFMG